MRRRPGGSCSEITEHTGVEDYAGLLKALQPLRHRGLRLAIDDAGAGYSSLRHILNLRPDLIKLDMELTEDIVLIRRAERWRLPWIAFARDIEIASSRRASKQHRAATLANPRSRTGARIFSRRPLPLDHALALQSIAPAGRAACVA